MLFSRFTSRGLVQQASRRMGAMAAATTSRNSAATASRRLLLRPLASTSSQSMKMMFSTQADTKNVSNPDMFCRQCEQTSDHYACTSVGVCGKTPETAASQDALIEVIKAVSLACVEARAAGKTVPEAANVWTLEATFSTLTNVNFSEQRIADYLQEGLNLFRNGDLEMSSAANPAINDISPTASVDEIEDFGRTVSLPKRQEMMGNEDCFSLNEIAQYGLKGACAYAAHCHQLGLIDEDIMTGVHEVFAKLASSEADMEGLLANAMKVGEVNAKVLAMLDQGHNDTFGTPEPTPVRMTAVEGKCILVSGHDFVDLEVLLKATEGTGINVYTHGEMLPAHGHPGLKKYPHLVGNYGTAWQNQKFEFAMFPGPIIVTTNCVLEPRRAYRKRLFTMNAVGLDGVQHIGEDRDYSKVIEAAQKGKGFPKTIEPANYHTVGFNHRAVLPLAGDVISAAQSGALSRIVLIGGCDGSQWDRNYFTELAEELPEDTLILTLGCAKNRFIQSEKLKGQTLANGMPRILDMGQCNDSYSAVVVATELAKALDCGVNDLPLSLALSHLEQKAAAVLLTLLNMGVKNIRLGPSLPAYVTPGVLQVLVDNYNIMPTGDVQEDIANIMEGK